MTPTDIRLIAVDMDGTLLLPDGTIPEGLWPLLERLRERGIVFAPASGRQYATLREMFGSAGLELDYIAENGAHVMRGGVEVSSDRLEPQFTASVVARLRRMDAEGVRLGVVLCGTRSAYIEDTDPVFVAEAEKYYRAMADAHPDVAAVARHRAPSHAQAGVLTVIERLLG